MDHTDVRQAEGEALRLSAAGVPADPRVIYSEDFSRQSAAASAIGLNGYAGGAAADGQTYTADSQWLPGASQCDGYIIAYTTATPSTNRGDGCDTNNAVTAPTARGGPGNLNLLVRDMGVFEGMTTAEAQKNQALTEYTNSSSGRIAAGNMLVSDGQKAVGATGHYYAISVVYGAQNCFSNHPLISTYLRVSSNGGSPTETQIGNQLDACGNSTAEKISRLTSKALLISAVNPTFGFRIYNAQPTGLGNDGALDLPQVIDVTPTIDKSFSPALVAPGQSSTLTFTITNTSELDEKDDWSFTDSLPAGLTLTNSAFGGTCANVAGTSAFRVNGSSGGSTITVTGGDLTDNQTSCTITANVTSSAEKSYTNDPHLTSDPSTPGNMTMLTGLVAGGPGTVRFLAPRVTVKKALGSARVTGGTHTNDQFAVALRTGSGTVVSSQTNATTQGTGDTVTAGSGTTGPYVASAGQTYYPTEAAAGTTDLSLYNAAVTCVDATGRTAGLPTDSAYTGSNPITPAAGADITCTITNSAAAPTVRLSKALSGTGRLADTDQFTVAIHTGSVTGPVVDDTTDATTKGIGTTVTAGTGTTGTYTGTAGTAYFLTEAAAGTARLADYQAWITCSDAAGVTSALPTVAMLGKGAQITPVAGAQISCVISNRPVPPFLDVVKTLTSAAIDPASGIGTATYTVTVKNTSPAPATYGALTDTPGFSAGLKVTGATWSATGGPAGGSATGAGPFILAGAGTSIGATTTQTFSVTVSFIYSGSIAAATCSGPGTGLFNAAALPAGQEDGSPTDDSACGSLTTVELQKVAQDGSTGLAGSTWQIQAFAGGVLGPTLGVPVGGVAQQTGLFAISGLVPGRYALVETKAPHGYELLGSPVTFTVDSTGAVTSVDSATLTTDPRNGLSRLVVRNYPAPQLPLLGGRGSSWYVATGIASLVFAAVLRLGPTIRRRRRTGRRVKR